MLALLLLALMAAAPTDTPLTFGDDTVGGPASDRQAELFLPQGAGPFPAVVVLPGCNGVAPHYRNWARRLNGWGYVAVVVDSYRPRGFTNVCNRGSEVPPRVQAQDAFAAADYLRRQPMVRGDRIGVLGFSHGGWAVMMAVLADAADKAHAPPFGAAVAFYPGCQAPTSPLVSDTLVLIGSADDWSPAANCERWRDAVQTAGHTLQLKIYTGALHGFDTTAAMHRYVGHLVGGDPQAAADATTATHAFLDEQLGR